MVGTEEVVPDADTTGRRVYGDGGWTGILTEVDPAVSGASQTRALVRVEPDGPNVLIPISLFREQGDGSLYLALTREALGLVAASDAAGLSAAETVVTAGRSVSPQTARDVVERVLVPLAAEEMAVTTERVPAGGVRVHKTVAERQEVVERAVLRDEVSVERVPVNRVVEGEMPRVRQEGEVMVVPLLEEVLVVEKRLMIREELRIHLRRVQENATQTVTLRREEAQVERFAPESDGASAATPETSEEPPTLRSVL